MVQVGYIPTKIVEINIMDIEGRSIKVSLWEEECMDLIKGIKDSMDQTSPLVIILQMFRLKKNEFSGEISLTTSYKPSRIISSGHCQDIEQYKIRMISGGACSSIATGSATTITNHSNDLESGDIVPITMEEFLTKDEGTYWIFGKIL